MVWFWLWLWLLWRLVSNMKPEWITAIATLVYAGFTLWIILETRKDRKLAHKPILEATLSASRFPKALTFKVKNVGKGPALTCRAKCTNNKGTDWLLNGNIPPIGSGESVELEFLLMQDDYKIPGEPIQLQFEYFDVFGSNYKNTIAEVPIDSV
jgi:hypothetical protein